VAVHRQPAYADLGYEAGAFPVAERAAARLLAPHVPWLGDADVDRVVAAVRDFARQYAGSKALTLLPAM
jgi:dTDP-4-amino-4,6-dideoxygalactose transaminase